MSSISDMFHAPFNMPSPRTFTERGLLIVSDKFFKALDTAFKSGQITREQLNEKKAEYNQWVRECNIFQFCS